MTLAAGTRLGPYEITAPLGAGGMGEVYRAKDTRLERSVALKVLPAELSNDADLKARFTREARAISALSHPHICALYDVGSEDGVDYLVMELLEGETLADRIAKGPLPTDAVLRIGIEIAEALDRAHRQGIVHRDLKPGNVMLTRSGVKLLDFGLAKLRDKGFEPALSTLPTRRAEGPLTEKGTVLGTFQYMSPEQLEGKDVDPRSDIFALGAVLYEMSTGRKAFSGASRASLIAAILSSEPPPISTIERMSPPALDRLVKTCLAKDADERWQSAHDIAAQLRGIAEGGSSVGAPAALVSRRKSRERAIWGTALVLALGAAAWLGTRSKPAPAHAPARFGISLSDAVASEPAFSHDATKLAFVAIESSGRRSLLIRDLRSLAPRELPGSDGASSPFFSHDDRSVAFVARGKLKRASLPAGPVADVCDVGGFDGGFWAPDGQIVFGTRRGPLQVVQASGGLPRPLTTLDAAAHESSQGMPQLLPDGRRFLYVSARDASQPVLVLSALGTTERRVLAGRAPRSRFASPGFLVFPHDNQLVAQEVDPRSLEPRGQPVAVADDARQFFAVQGTRALAYEVEGSVPSELTWYDRSGKTRTPLEKLSGYFFSLDLSRDGRRVAYERKEGSARNIWVTDLARQTSTRLTFGAALDDSPVFSPDGSRIAFDSNQSGTWDIYTRASDGSGTDTLVLKPGADDVIVEDWSRDGRFLVYGVAFAGTTGWDVWALPLDGGKPFPFLASRFNEAQARLSPDGKFLAYTSDESGRREVYVQNFPAGGGKVQITSNGGSQPIWKPDGKELFFLADDSRIDAVPITSSRDGFEAGIPVPLSEPLASGGGNVPTRNVYAVSPDGNRFLVNSALRREPPVSLHVLLDWADLAR
jgi:Tol biopolymer transport system component